MKKNLLSLVLTLLCAIPAWAQKELFTKINESAIQLKSGDLRVVFPVKYSTFSLDFNGMKQQLGSLPSEQNIFNRKTAPILELPMPDGKMAAFRVWESSIQEPGLQNRFPDIRTYAGQGIDDPYATIRFDFNPYDGFHAQILSPNGRIYVDPYARGNMNDYISYYQRDNHRNPAFICENPEISDMVNKALVAPLAGACRGTQLYTYRLAVACTGEYAVAVGGTTAPLLHSKIVTTVNRVDGVYESEVSVRLVLIATNNLIEFLSAASDPFTGNNSASTLINESQTQITSLIGASNFDIGHTFSTGAGGLAGLGVVCSAGNKARGVTGNSNPVGDGYDIDYVAHEMGHQFSGNHTFNGATGSCSGANRNGSTAYEPGSGTTIQAYAGICGVDDIQPHSDPYFHSISFDEISTFVEAGGAACRVVTATGNTLPVITAMNNNGANIPLGTPFTLTGAATDADGDAITYNWEEWDLGAQGLWNAGASTTTAPLFKSRIPKTSGSRTFPDMAVILAGYPASPAATMDGLKGETLPLTARLLKFRLTVRDNRVNGGGVVTGGNGCMVGFTGTFQVNVITGTGPFVVTLPNGGESYPGSTAQTVTWNIAGTNAAPISVSNVKISLSTDGGLTYPTVINASTPNDGSETITIPNIPTTTARLKIEAVGNIFFDISNANFTITNAAPGFDFDNPAAASITCGTQTSAAITLGTVSYFSYITPINLSASGVPSGTSISFGTNPVVPGNSTVVTLNNTNTLSAGSYNITITGVSGSITLTRVLTYTVLPGTGPSIDTHPASQTVCSGTNATFIVSASGTVTSYQWQLSTDGGTTYSNIPGANTSSYTATAVTTSQSGQRFRVIVSGQCNSATSNQAILNVNASPTVPVITPANPVICLGSVVTLNASALSPVTATSGIGTSTSVGNTTASTLGPNALQIYYGGNKQQMLYRATELTALGLVNGSSITAIKLNLVTADLTRTLQNLVVKMKNSTSTTMAAWETGMFTVRPAASYSPVVGLNTILLTTPFAWDGINSLVIEINYSNGDAGTIGSVFNTAKYSATTFVSTRFYRVDNASAATVDAFVGTPSFTYSQRNDLVFEFTAPTSITWSPLAGLYNEIGASTNYTGGITPVVFAKPAASGNAAYTATASNAAGCTKSSVVTITVNPLPVVGFSGLASSYCSTSGTVTLTGNPSGGTFSGPGISGNSFDPAVAGVGGPYTITYTYTNGNGCTNVATQQVTVQNCTNTISVNLKLFVQGYYAGLGTMQPVLLNQGIASLSTETDTVTIELYQPGTFSLVDSKKAVLSTNGALSVSFNQAAGSYYVAIKHRNTVQTWTANAINCTAATPVYDFSTAANKAFADNQVEVEPGVWAMFTGDINQDEFIDVFDYGQFNDDNLAGVNSSYVATDMNGDGFVDVFDYQVYNDNNLAGIGSIHP